MEQLNVSKQVTQDQEEDLDQEEDMDQVTQELRDCEQDNSRLLRSMDRSLQEGRPVPVLQPGEVLLRKLLEAEAAAAAAAQELSALRVSVNNLLGSGPTVSLVQDPVRVWSEQDCLRNTCPSVFCCRSCPRF